MREDASAALTAAVRLSQAGTSDPRLRFVMDRLIAHLHAFIRETELTEAEWLRAIQFLTATGQISDDRARANGRAEPEIRRCARSTRLARQPSRRSAMR